MDDAVQLALDRYRRWGGHAALDAAIDAFPDVAFYLAGGVLRDAFLGSGAPPKDFDIFLTGARAQAVLAHLAGHGHVRLGAFGSPEWCPAAAPGTDCDVIPVDRFDNGLWRCEDMVDALNQFDFTGNAIAVDLRNHAVLDPQNGRRHLAERILRAVRFDYPDEPIAPQSEITRNAVLWWRLLHYAHLCDLRIEPVTLAWLRAHRHYRDTADAFARTFRPMDPAALAPVGG